MFFFLSGQVVTASITCTQAFAWDGTHATTGSSIEIERGQLIRSGRTIEVHDSERGYKEYDVDSVRRYGRSVEIEATDTETGESTTLEMDGD
ncbi:MULTISPECIES: DUF5334 family protein [unclassified Bradyrhizobium]|uniref:DUF5334 family protein n=1 Tax=unclassified Bradyrhizobium TaxID=2631580 RepID=UPI0023B1A416|nr:DUF5334 family protein [Bradyrhizobium sp. CSS354]MDE5465432.1 hypothetical protein [Bradyrhizobium sp. CSS354]